MGDPFIDIAEHWAVIQILCCVMSVEFMTGNEKTARSAGMVKSVVMVRFSFALVQILS